jgi:hypothetical protein
MTAFLILFRRGVHQGRIQRYNGVAAKWNSALEYQVNHELEDAERIAHVD